MPTIAGPERLTALPTPATPVFHMSGCTTRNVMVTAWLSSLSVMGAPDHDNAGNHRISAQRGSEAKNFLQDSAEGPGAKSALPSSQSAAPATKSALQG